MIQRLGVALIAAAIWAVACSGEASAATPRVAIVMCEDTYAGNWTSVQASSQAAVGLAGLVGVPYDTLLLDELLALPDPPYTSVWFSWCLELSDARHAALVAFLADYVGRGGSVFMDGPIGVYTPEPSSSYRGTAALAGILKVEDGGWYPLAGYRVTASNTSHPVATRMGVSLDEPLSQGLHAGTQLVELADPTEPGGAVLLDLTHPSDPSRYPYLVVAETDGGGRVVAVSRYASTVGAATSFRNTEPRGFYDNRVLPYLLGALEWLEQRGSDPIVGLQLSHAPMTAIGRLDGDWSGHAGPTSETLEYLCELGRTTGLTTAYGIVSSFVLPSDWSHYKPGSEDLEELGGSVGSHSHTHKQQMSSELTAAEWSVEVPGSIDMVRATMHLGAAPARVFINPGGTIEAADYARFFAGVDLFMTHGFETAAPYASGVVGFGLPAGIEPTVVVNNVPAPDYQWLYSNSWIYSVDEAANNQAKILDYYQHTVQRGVLYNEMWHDYSIGGELEPVHFPNTVTVRPLFDVNREHFEHNPVYMPSAEELVAKFHIASNAVHTSVRTGNLVLVTIDYSAVPLRYRGHVAGMGLRIEGGGIGDVKVDGAPHPAFSNDTVMVPRPTSTTQNIEVTLGSPAPCPRLRFASKPVAVVFRSADVLTWTWSNPGLHHKFCVDGPEGTIILGADRYSRASAESMCGQVLAGSATTQLSTVVIDAGPGEFVLDEGDRAIDSAILEENTVTLVLADGLPARLRLRTRTTPLGVAVSGAPLAVDYDQSGWEIEIPSGPAVVSIELDRPGPHSAVVGATDVVVDCLTPSGDPTSARADGTAQNETVLVRMSGCRAGQSTDGGAVLLLGLLLLWRRRKIGQTL